MPDICMGSIENLQLARDHCTAPTMLVCGVIDGVARSRAVTRDNGTVAISDLLGIAPFFEATGEAFMSKDNPTELDPEDEAKDTQQSEASPKDETMIGTP